MDEKTKFRSDFYYDLSAYKEFNSLLTHCMGRNTLMNLLTLVSMLFLLTQLNNQVTLILTMILSGYFLLYHLFRHVRGKDGGVTYQQILRSNEDSIPHQIVTLEEAGIRSRNPRTGNDILDNYESIRYLMESENLLVLVTDQKMCHILDKRYLTGGTQEQLIACLREICPKLRKRIQTGRLSRIIQVALLAVAALGLVLGSLVLFRNQIQNDDRLSNQDSYTEMAEALKKVGIVISQDSIAEIEAFDAEYALENGDYYAEYPEASKIQDLLYWEGCGIWNEETWEWTPSESGIYWFDTEVFNLACIYTDFLRGVDALSEELTFTNISEDYTQVDIEGGYGTIAVAFEYEGKYHELEAIYDYDWFDTEMLRSLGRILGADDKAESLWFAWDGGQGIFLYYGNDAEMKILEKQSGLDFLSCELMGIVG